MSGARDVRDYHAVCALGLEGVLEAELAGLGAEEIRVLRGGASFRGDLRLGYAAKLWRQCPGARAFVLSGSPESTRHLRFKAARRWALRDGPVDCRLLEYPIGPRREPAGPGTRAPRWVCALCLDPSMIDRSVQKNRCLGSRNSGFQEQFDAYLGRLSRSFRYRDPRITGLLLEENRHLECRLDYRG